MTFDQSQLDSSAEYVMRAGQAVMAIAKVLRESDTAATGFISKTDRMGLMTAVELIGEGLVISSCDLRQIGKEG